MFLLVALLWSGLFLVSYFFPAQLESPPKVEEIELEDLEPMKEDM